MTKSLKKQPYFYDGSLPLAEKDSSGKLTKLYINDGQGVVGEIQPVYDSSNNLSHNLRTYLMFDSLGSASLVTGENGMPLQKYYYTPYGKATNVSNDPLNNLQFVGRYGGFTDADAGLTYFWHRWYDADNGRWISRDPIKQYFQICLVKKSKSSTFLNIYNYGLNNVLLNIDPDGRQPFPGYNYCGQGNNPGTQPTNDLDAACQRHDNCYNKLGLEGPWGVINPFLPKCVKDERDKCDKALCDDAILNFVAKTDYDKSVQAGVIMTFCGR